MHKKRQGLANSLRDRGVALRIMLILVLLVALLYGVFLKLIYSAYKGNVIDSLGAATEDAMISTGTRINDLIGAKEKTTMQLYYDSCLDWMETPADLTEAQNERIDDALTAMRWSDTGMTAAYVKSLVDDTVWGGANYADVIRVMAPHEEAITSAGGRCQWYWTYELGGRAKECKFILARALNSRNRKNVAILYVVLSYNSITQPMRSLTSGSTQYLVAGDGMVLYCSDPDQIQMKMDTSYASSPKPGQYLIREIDGKEMLTAYRKISNVGWLCTAQISVRDSLYASGFLTRINLLLALSLAVLLLLMAYVLNRYVFKPISLMKRSMDEYADGSLSATNLKPVGVGEFRSLSTHFNEMTSRIDMLMQAYREETEEKNRQSMLALTAQMTPHFIYNSLNTIRWMAIIAKQSNIQKVVESLNNMFMCAVRVDDDQYTVGDELNLIEDYATIQKARFMNFDLLLEVDENCYDLKIIKFLLQPIVENAIIHGLGRGTVLDTSIVIRGWRDEDLHIQVIDEGIGFDVDGWRVNPSRKDDHSNIGIQNVEKMIALTYGEPYGLVIESKPGEGTCVTYTLPAIPADGEC